MQAGNEDGVKPDPCAAPAACVQPRAALSRTGQQGATRSPQAMQGSASSVDSGRFHEFWFGGKSQSQPVMQ